MATCKDCLHHEVCYLIEHYGLDPTIEDVEFDCDDFKESLRPKGRWCDCHSKDGMIVGFLCSECSKTYDLDTNYCPNCGAKMEGE